MSQPPSPDTSILDTFRLDDQVALLVGGSRGLGKSIALGFAQAGAKTIIAARSEAVCRETATEIAESTGRESIPLTVDVTDTASVEKLYGAVLERFGRLDILVNSAGINARYAIEDCPPELFKEVIDINLTGAWMTCREAARQMKKQGSGSIINIGSALSTVALPERTPYCSSKFGIIGLTQALALELAAHGVRANAICPGFFMTEMNEPLKEQPDKLKMVVSQMALGRSGELQEIRGAALFLASAASSFVTGSSLYVDAGWTSK